MKKAFLWAVIGFTSLFFGAATCSSLAMHDKLPFDVNRPNSEFVTPIEVKDALSQEYDYVFLAFSDIQCRDGEECKKLAPRIWSLNDLFPDSKIKKAIFVVGDLVQYGRDEEIKEYLEIESKIRKDLVFRVCGNHDIKSGLANCLKLIKQKEIFYGVNVKNSNLYVLGVSNWHDEAPKNSDLQKYVPEQGIDFYKVEATKALKEGRIIFGLLHEKPHDVARFNDPVRNYFSWIMGLRDESSIYNSEYFEEALDNLPSEELCGNGLRMIQFFGHTHAGRQWPGGLVISRCILFINTSSIRTSDHSEDLRKYSFFGKPIGKFLNKVFPWSKYSWATILLFRCDSDEAMLLTRNLSKKTWFKFAYKLKLGVPARCSTEY